MFEHLDDPTGFVPSATFRAAVHKRGISLRRRHRLGRAAFAVATVTVLSTAAPLYVARRNASIERIDVAAPLSEDGAKNVLAVATDGFDNADALAFVRFEADGSVSILQIPRDLWIDRDQRRLATARSDGVQSLVESVVHLTGVPVDHYLEIDFEGFTGLIDAIGGLDVAVTETVRDMPSGLELQPSECATLDGTTSLALARSRHLQRLDDGRWQSDPSGDIGRIERAAALLTLSVQKLGDVRDPLEIDRMSRVFAAHASLDSGFGLDEVTDLGRRFLQAPPPVIHRLPVEPVRTSSGALALQMSPGTHVLADFGGRPAEGANATATPTQAQTQALVPITSCP